MSNHETRAVQLRGDPNVHFNCAQAVLIPFAEEQGLPAGQAAAIAAHFGSGMRMGGTCGAVTGGLMALGILGCGADAAKAFLREFQQLSQTTDCSSLLRICQEQGTPKQGHCLSLILQAIRLVEKYSAEP